MRKSYYKKTFPQGFEKTVKEFITTDTIQETILQRDLLIYLEITRCCNDRETYTASPTCLVASLLFFMLATPVQIPILCPKGIVEI